MHLTIRGKKMERGYIKLYRAIEENELLANDNTAYVVFIKLLTHADRFTGAYKTGRFKLAAICNLKPTTLYAALKRLESSTMIRQQSDNKMTTIYICNWHTYQQDIDSTVTGRRRANDTKQEREKERKYTHISTKKSELLNILNEVTGRKFRNFPDEKRTRQTSKMFSPLEVRTALEKMKRDEWHKPRMSQLSAGYLLATDNIDKFLNYKTAAEITIGDRKDYTPRDDRKLFLQRESVAPRAK